MDAELKAKWLVALRSGEYQQTRQVLRDDLGHCCLGVLCVVSGAQWRDHEEVDEGEYKSYIGVPVAAGELLSAGEDQELSPRFRKRIGLSEEQHNYLMMLNDGASDKDIRKHSFAEIADYIEKNL